MSTLRPYLFSNPYTSEKCSRLICVAKRKLKIEQYIMEEQDSVIIIKTMVLLPRAYVTVVDFGYPILSY